MERRRGATVTKGVQRRREVVVQLRESGLRIAQVAASLGPAVATVQRDLEATPHTPPEWVLGRDGKRHPTAKNGHAPRGNNNPVVISENGHRAES